MPYTKLYVFGASAALMLYEADGTWVLSVRSYISRDAERAAYGRLLRAIYREVFPERFKGAN